jgi:hypothetical protein
LIFFLVSALPVITSPEDFSLPFPNLFCSFNFHI